MKIAVLGSGISGLLATKALVDKGVNLDNITILTKDKKPKKPRGFTILHYNCRMDLEHTKIIVMYVGSKQNYKDKLGYNGDIECSWDSYTGQREVFGYNMGQAMDKLYKRYKNRMIQFEVVPDDIQKLKNSYDYIISTIPPFNIYKDPYYDVEYTKIWISKEKTFDKNKIPNVTYYGDNSIMLRSSKNIFGYDYVEYCEPVGDAVKVYKPIRVTIYPKKNSDEKIIQVGRYGKWNKKILAHQVYWNTYGMIKKDSIQTL